MRGLIAGATGFDARGFFEGDELSGEKFQGVNRLHHTGAASSIISCTSLRPCQLSGAEACDVHEGSRRSQQGCAQIGVEGAEAIALRRSPPGR